MPKRKPEERTARREEYGRYLKGRIWKAIRQAAIYRAGGQCEWCKGTEMLHVHHKQYPKAFGTETPEMLQVLCDQCHAEAHSRPYLIHKAAREKRLARRERLKSIEREAKEKEQAAKKAKRTRRRAMYVLAPTPSLKDRFSVGHAGTHSTQGDAVSQRSDYSEEVGCVLYMALLVVAIVYAWAVGHAGGAR